jgi:hypothetical protein
MSLLLAEGEMDGVRNATPLNVAVQTASSDADGPVELNSSPGHAHPASTAFIGAFVAIFAVFDTLLLGVPIMMLAAWIDPLLIFIATGALLTVVNRAACGWLDREWDLWMGGPGKRVEKKLDSMRSSRLMEHPVRWIAGGSDVRFAFAASLTNAIITVAGARLIGGKRVGTHRVLIASVTYSLFFVGVYSLVGSVIGNFIGAS